jgi:hypothetical protein
VAIRDFLTGFLKSKGNGSPKINAKQKHLHYADAFESFGLTLD